MSGSGLASPLLWHLDQLVVGLAAKNAEETASQISSLCAEFGDDARIHVIGRLLRYADENRSANMSVKLDILREQLDASISLPNYASIICSALEAASSSGSCRILRAGEGPSADAVITAKGLASLADLISLSPPSCVGVGLSISQSSRPMVSAQGVQFLVHALAHMFASGSTTGSASGKSSSPYLPPKLLHGTLYMLRTHPAASADKAALTACVRQLQATHGPQVQALAALPSMQGPAVLVDHVAAGTRATRIGRAIYGAADAEEGSMAAARLAALDLRLGSRADAVVSSVCASAGELTCAEESIALQEHGEALREAATANAAVDTVPKRGGRAARRAREAAEKAAAEAEQRVSESRMAAVPRETASQALRLSLEELCGVVLELGPSGAGSVDGLRRALALLGRGAPGRGLMPLHAREVAALLLAVGNSMPAGWKPADVGDSEGPQATGEGQDGAAPHAARDGARVLPSWAAQVVCAAAGSDTDFPAPPALVSSSGGSASNFAPSSQGWSSWSPSVFSRLLQEDHSPVWDAIANGLDMPSSASAASTHSGSTQLGAGGISPIGPIAHPGAAWFIFRTVKVGQGGTPFPGHALLGRWQYPQSQIQALSYAVDMPASELSFAGVSKERLMRPITGSTSGCGVANQAWCAMDTYSTILRLAHVGGLQPQSLKLLDKAQSQANELFVLGMAGAKADAGEVDGLRDSHVLRERVFSTVVSRLFAGVLAIPVYASIEERSGLSAESLAAVLRQYGQQQEQAGSVQSVPIVQSAVSMESASASLTSVPPLAMTVLVRLWDMSPALLVNTIARTSRVLTAYAASGPGQQSREQQAESELLLRGNLPAPRVLPLQLRFAARVGKLLTMVIGAVVEAKSQAAGVDVKAEVLSKLPRLPAHASGLNAEDYAILASLLCIPLPSIAMPIALGVCGSIAPARQAALLDAWLLCCFGGSEVKSNDMPTLFDAKEAAESILDLLQGVTATHGNDVMVGNPGGVPAAGSIVDTTAVAAMVRHVSAFHEAFQYPQVSGPEEDDDAASRASGSTHGMTGTTELMSFSHAITDGVRVIPGLKIALDIALRAPENSRTTTESGASSGTSSAPTGSSGSASADQVDLPSPSAVLQFVFQARTPPAAAVQQLVAIRDSGRESSLADVGTALYKLIALWNRVDAMNEQELRLSGSLIGAAIQARLLAQPALAVVLRLVCEALRSRAAYGDEGKRFRFGVFALEYFWGRLPAWANLCRYVVGVTALYQHFRQFVNGLQTKMYEFANSYIGYGQEVAPAELVAQVRDPSAAIEWLKAMPPAALVLSREADETIDLQAAAATAEAMSSAIDSAGVASIADRPEGVTPGKPAVEATSTPASTTSRAVAMRPMLPTPFQRHRARISRLGQRFTMILRAVAAGEKPPTERPQEESSVTHYTHSLPRYRFGPAQQVAYFDKKSDETKRRLAGASGGVKDQLHFKINNLSPYNVAATAAEIRDTVAPKHLAWFGHYLVVKRVSMQPNFHGLHASFLKEVDSPVLYKEVLRSTLESARELLGSSSISTNSKERQMLKSIGAWLGLITLARGRPLLRSELDLRELLLQAFESGRLIACVAFVSKVLEGAAAANAPRVFMPPNPWTVGILGLLRELYGLEHLKLNLKFEIDMICKVLEVELRALPTSNLLAHRMQPNLASTPDFSTKASQSPDAVPGLAIEDAYARAESHLRRRARGSFASASHPSEMTAEAVAPELALAAGLQELVVVSPGLALTQAASGLILEPIVAKALSMAVHRVMKAVVDRSSTIACNTAKYLVAKDFALDPSSKRMVAACVLTAQHLASSMAVVTCQEQIRSNTLTYLRDLLTKSPEVHTAVGAYTEELVQLLYHAQVGENTAGDQSATSRVAPLLQAVEVLTKDHVDLGCALVEAAAADRAYRDCQSMLNDQVEARKLAEKEGRQHRDMESWESGSQWPAQLPAQLRPGSQGLLYSYLAVYRAFDQYWHQGYMTAQSAVGNTAGSTGAVAVAPAASGAGAPSMATARQQAHNASSHVAIALKTLPAAMEMLGRYQAAMAFLRRAIAETADAWPAGGAPPSISALDSTHPLVSAVEEVRHAATPLPSSDAGGQANPNSVRARAAAAAAFAYECVEALLDSAETVRSAASARWSQAWRESRGGAGWDAKRAEAARRAAYHAAADVGLLPMQALVAALGAASVTTGAPAVASATAGTLVRSPRERGLDAAVATAVSRAGVLVTRDLDALSSAAAAEDSSMAGETASSSGLGVRFAAAIIWRCAVRGRVQAVEVPAYPGADAATIDALLYRWSVMPDGAVVYPTVLVPALPEAQAPPAENELVELDAGLAASAGASDDDAHASIGRSLRACPSSARLLLRGHISPHQLPRTMAQLELAARSAAALSHVAGAPVSTEGVMDNEATGPAWGWRLACLLFSARAVSAGDAAGADPSIGAVARVPAWVLRMARRADTLPDPEAGLVLAAADRSDEDLSDSQSTGGGDSGHRGRYDSRDGDQDDGDEDDEDDDPLIPQDDLGVLDGGYWALQSPSRSTRAIRRVVLSLLRDIDAAHRMASTSPGKGGASLMGVLAHVQQSGAFDSEAASLQLVTAAVEVAVRADAAAEAAARAGSGMGSDGARLLHDHAPAAADAPPYLIFRGMGAGADAVSTLLALLVRGAHGVSAKVAMLSRFLAATVSVLTSHADAWAARYRMVRAEGAARRHDDTGLLGTARAAAAARQDSVMEPTDEASALVESEEYATLMEASPHGAIGSSSTGDLDWWVEDPEDDEPNRDGHIGVDHEDDESIASSAETSAGQQAEAAAPSGSASRRAARRVWRMPMARIPFDPRPYSRVMASLVRVCLPPGEAPYSVDPATLDALNGGSAEVAAQGNGDTDGSPTAAGPRAPVHASEAVLASARTQLTLLASTAVCNALWSLRPQRVPAFSLSWLSLLCHRSLLPAVIHMPGARGWPMLLRLVRCMFSFLGDTLRACPVGMPTTLRLFYRGVLRLVVILLHDAQDFLADNHHYLCEVLPPVCLQLRNLVLSAAPRRIARPEPLTDQLKIDTIPEMKVPPIYNADAAESLSEPEDLVRDITSYIASGGPPSLPTRVAEAMILQDHEVAAVSAVGSGKGQPPRYSHGRLQALVALVAQTAATDAAGESSRAKRSPAVTLLKQVLQQLSPSGKYLLLDAMASQLRYPSSHTYFFSMTVLRLFAEAPDDAHREILTRVLLQKLICNRPHPWGLLITFIELIKVPDYSFWSRPFTHCAPEIERLFDSVARSCLGYQTSAAARAEAAKLGGEAGPGRGR